MSIGDMHEALLGCAGHFEAVSDRFQGPISESLGVVDGHLGTIATALEVALESLNSINEVFARLEEPSREAAEHAQAAAQIIRSVTRGSSNNDIAPLRSQSRDLRTLTRDTASGFSEMGKQSTVANERESLVSLLAFVKNHAEVWRDNRELIVDSGEAAQEWSDGIRAYVQGL